MAELLLFHHAQGLTAGCLAFAEALRAAGHTVHTPDLFAGNTFATLADGINHAQQVGFDTIIERGRRAAGSLPTGIVYAGFSFGVLPAYSGAPWPTSASNAVRSASISDSSLK